MLPFQTEQKMDALHKLKSSQFRKTMEVRKRGLNVQDKGSRLAPIIANMACRSSCSASLGPAWPCWCGRPCENCFSLRWKEEEGFLCQPGKWTSATPPNPTPKEEVPPLLLGHGGIERHVLFVRRRRRRTSTSAEIKKRRIRTWTETPTLATPNR